MPVDNNTLHDILHSKNLSDSFYYLNNLIISLFWDNNLINILSPEDKKVVFCYYVWCLSEI